MEKKKKEEDILRMKEHTTEDRKPLQDQQQEDRKPLQDQEQEDVKLLQEQEDIKLLQDQEMSLILVADLLKKDIEKEVLTSASETDGVTIITINTIACKIK